MKMINVRFLTCWCAKTCALVAFLSSSSAPLQAREPEVRRALPVDSSAPDTALSSDLLQFLPPVRPASGEATPAAKFLTELSLLTQDYMLLMGYKQGLGNNVVSDGEWIRDRMRGLHKLLQSPSGQAIPENLRVFCQRALVLDVMLHMTAMQSAGNGDAARQEVQDLLGTGMRNLPGLLGSPNEQQQANDSFLGQALPFIGRSIMRAEATRVMFEKFLEFKRSRPFHQEWSTLLKNLAKTDPTVTRFAADPRASDPTWHFMRSTAADDHFFGKTVSSRGSESFWPQIKGLRRKSLGNLANGPIRININSRNGTFAIGYTFDIPPGGVPMIKMECQRGHFGLYTMWDESAWVARGGRVDMQNHGRIDFGRMPNVGQQSSLSICHLPVFGTGEDLEAQGSILIYLPRVHGDATTAGRAARQVNAP